MVPEGFMQRPVPKSAKARIEPFNDALSGEQRVVVTLQRGWSFSAHQHEPVRAFDSFDTAMQSTDDTYPCQCATCAISVTANEQRPTQATS